MQLPWIPMFIVAMVIPGSRSAGNNNTGEARAVACGKYKCSQTEYCENDVTDDITTISTIIYSMELTTSVDNSTIASENSTDSKLSSQNNSSVNNSTEAATTAKDTSFKCRPCDDLCPSHNTSDVHLQQKYSICRQYCTENFMFAATKDKLGVAAAVLCASIVTVFVGTLIYTRVRKKIRARQQDREEEDTLFIMQDPEWMSAMSQAAQDTALCPTPAPTGGDLGDGIPVSLPVPRPGLSGGEYGSVTLHAADVQHIKI